MKESQLLNETLDRINDNGTVDAYNFLVSNLDSLEEKSSQVYNFLYCLAATSSKANEAIDWMKEAVEVEGYWYRPEVFEDEDLDTIRDDDRFKKYCKLSNKKFLEAKSKVETVFTWEEKEKDNIIVVLHGNQQNNEISKDYWSDLKLPKYQIEYLQSKEIDSYQLFRWEDEGNGVIQLTNALSKSDWKKYTKKVLSGFSAGCNVILRSLNETNLECDKIILVSPWMPCIENDLIGIINNLIEKEVEVLIICGKEDEDSYPQCIKFEDEASKLGLRLNVVYIDNLGHDYPDDFLDIVDKFLK